MWNWIEAKRREIKGFAHEHRELYPVHVIDKTFRIIGAIGYLFTYAYGKELPGRVGHIATNVAEVFQGSVWCGIALYDTYQAVENNHSGPWVYPGTPWKSNPSKQASSSSYVAMRFARLIFAWTLTIRNLTRLSNAIWPTPPLSTGVTWLNILIPAYRTALASGCGVLTIYNLYQHGLQAEYLVSLVDNTCDLASHPLKEGWLTVIPYSRPIGQLATIIASGSSLTVMKIRKDQEPVII